MRILYIHHTLPPDSFAGSEIYQYRLAQAMSKRHDVSIIYREADAAAPEYQIRERLEPGLRIFAINNTFKECTSFEMTYRNVAIEERIGDLIKSLDPEVVHFGHVTCLSTELPATARRRGARVFMTLHDFWLLCQRGQLVRRDYSICSGPTPTGCSTCLADQIAVGPRTKQAAHVAGKYLRFAASPPLRRLAQWYARMNLAFSREAKDAIRKRTISIRGAIDAVDCFFSPSRFLRDYFIGAGVPPDKISFLRLGLDKSFLAQYRRTSSPTLRLAYVGSIMATKGLHVLLEAMRLLHGEDVSLGVHGSFQPFHGDATYEARTRPLLQQPRVTFAGPFRHDELGRILSDVDVLVVPSVWYENSPLTIQEAFEAGIPVIASDLGGMKELVSHGKNGLLFSPGSPADLARRIRTLTGDRALLSRLASGAPQQKAIAENACELEVIYRDYLR